MDIWFDIAHIPQYNFYRWLMLRLAGEGNRVFVTVLRRGKLPIIVQKELGGVENVEISPVGLHRSTKLSAIVEANLLRIIQLLRWSRCRHIDIGYSNGYQLALVGALRHFPTYSFDDDPETIDYRPKLWFNTETCYCIYGNYKELSPKAVVLPVLKEWAYLAPGYFKPDRSVLDEFGLEPKNYLFVREVSVGTINYDGQAFGAVRDVASRIPSKLKVLLSLECKEIRDQYPQSWILLKEPLKDVHSLIYYSAGLVSSGDSMAREAALLGVPSFYLGIRDSMPANRAAAELGGLESNAGRPFVEWVSALGGNPEELLSEQEARRVEMSSRMVDINQIMYDKTNNLR